MFFQILKTKIIISLVIKRSHSTVACVKNVSMCVKGYSYLHRSYHNTAQDVETGEGKDRMEASIISLICIIINS